MVTGAPPYLSHRARQLVERPPFASYLFAHFERLETAFDPQTRPDGYIGLCVAENRLLWPELSARLAAIPPAPDRVLGYDAMIGAWSFRAQLASFMSQRIVGRPVRPEHLSVLAGAGSALELLFYAIGDPGDVVLVPTPSYAGFWPDLETRDALRIQPVPTTSADGFRLTPELLDRAWARAPGPVRGLLFTTPDNPLGRVHSTEEAEAVLSWAQAKGIHVVFDEVYALSVFGDAPFASGASLRETLGDRVHVVWAFSKDFGASGLRCGVVLSENEQVRQTIDALSYWSATSGHTQYLLQSLLADGDWLDDYLATQRVRLRSTYDAVADRLRAYGISFMPADGGIFVLCDLRPFLPQATPQGEDALWRKLLDEARVNLTPGSACRVEEPGFFRICWASLPLPTVLAGLDRVGACLGTADLPA